MIVMQLVCPGAGTLHRQQMPLRAFLVHISRATQVDKAHHGAPIADEFTKTVQSLWKNLSMSDSLGALKILGLGMVIA
jgi:hypothetical protein